MLILLSLLLLLLLLLLSLLFQISIANLTMVMNYYIRCRLSHTWWTESVGILTALALILLGSGWGQLSLGWAYVRAYSAGRLLWGIIKPVAWGKTLSNIAMKSAQLKQDVVAIFEKIRHEEQKPSSLVVARKDTHTYWPSPWVWQCANIWLIIDGWMGTFIL